MDSHMIRTKLNFDEVSLGYIKLATFAHKFETGRALAQSLILLLELLTITQPLARHS